MAEGLFALKADDTFSTAESYDFALFEASSFEWQRKLQAGKET